MNLSVAQIIRRSALALLMVAAAAQNLIGQSAVAVSGTVTNALTGTPVASATVRVVGTTTSSATRSDGSYHLVVGRERFELRVTAVGFVPASQVVGVSAVGSSIVSFALQPSSFALNEVITIGTRTGDRTVTTSTVPVDVISSQLLENTGMIETWQQLKQVVPSVNVPHIPIGDNHARPVTLRGLAPHHALVLVNGKRRHQASTLLAGPSVPNTGFTDLSPIPQGAIDRIEILRDGASAEYGSDAIGGVVNVILKSGSRREMQTSAGSVYSSEHGRDFRDGQLFDVSSTLGFSSSRGGQIVVSADVENRSGTNRAYPDLRQQYFTGDPRNSNPPGISSYLGNGAVHSRSFFVNASSPITSRMDAYAFGGVAKRDGLAPDAFFRRPLDTRTVRAIFPDGFLPRIESGIRDISFAGGVRGLLRAWRWDLSSAWGNNDAVYHVHNSNNVSLGAASPTEFYAGRVAVQQWTTNLDLSRDIMLGGLGITLSGGGELRAERYQIRAGDQASWRDGGIRIPEGPQVGQRAAAGAQGMLGFRPIDEVSASRSNSAVYLEGEARPIARLLLQLAGRAERYSDFGLATTEKAASRLQLMPGFAIRASMSNGFRAPALTQQYFANTRTSFRVVNGQSRVLTTRVFPVSTPEARLIGAVPLQPETSTNLSGGLVLDLPRLPAISADLFQITIRDRIILTSSISDTSLIRLFDENGMAGLDGGSYYRNARDTRTRGADVVVSHALVFGPARQLRILAGFNHTRTVVTRFAPAPPQLAKFESVLSGRAGRGVLENGQPRQTISLTLNYKTKRFGLNVNNQRAGPTAQLDQDNPSLDQILNPKWIANLLLSYQVRPRVDVSVSAANLFDVYPDEWRDFKDGVNARGVSMQGIFRHPGGLSPFGMNGRTMYLRLAYK